MKKKQTKYAYTNLEKQLTIAGLILIAVGCIANAFSFNESTRFMVNNDVLSFIYYARFFFLLGGGFAIGYLFTKNRASKLYGGVFYTALTSALFYLIDIVRFGFNALLGDLSYPWARILFYGAPLLALIIAAIIAYISHYRKDQQSLNPFTKKALLFAFLAYEIYTLASGAYFLIIGTATIPEDMSIWLIIGSYLTMPLVIATVAYLMLNAVKAIMDRLFYAAFIGTLYAVLTMVLWEFRIDASAEATHTFATAVNAISLISVSIILWRARKAITRHNHQ